MQIAKVILNFACFLAMAQTTPIFLWRAGMSQSSVALDSFLSSWGERRNPWVEFLESSICEMREVACLKTWEALSIWRHCLLR